MCTVPTRFAPVFWPFRVLSTRLTLPRATIREQATLLKDLPRDALRSEPRTGAQAPGDSGALSDKDGGDPSSFAPLPGASGVCRARRGRVRRPPTRFVAGARGGRGHLLHALQSAPGRQAPGVGLPD